MVLHTIELTRPLRGYFEKFGWREPAILARLRDETIVRPNPHFQIAPEEGQFLSVLTRSMQARNVIEVGVFTGYSSLCIAEALPPDGRLVALDIDEEATAIARRYWEEWGVSDRVDLRLGPAVESMRRLLEEEGPGAFDMVFIDADKVNYEAYYELSLKLVRDNGLICIDNTLWEGKVAVSTENDEETAAIRDFNTMIHADERVQICLVPIADGVTLAVKRS